MSRNTNRKKKIKKGTVEWFLKEEEKFRDRLLQANPGSGLAAGYAAMWIPAFINQSLLFSRNLLALTQKAVK